MYSYFLRGVSPWLVLSSIASTGVLACSGGGNGTDSGGDGDGDGGGDGDGPAYVPGPSVLVTAGDAHTIAFGGEQKICRISDAGSVECQTPGAPWEQLFSSPSGDAFVDLRAELYLSDAAFCARTAQGEAFCQEGSSTGSGPVFCDATSCGTLPAGTTFKKLAVDDAYGCGILTDDTIACFGEETGDDSTIPPLGTFVDIAATADTVCAIATDSSMLCWGDDFYTETDDFPGAYVQVEANRGAFCALTTEGRVSCSGSRDPSVTSATTFASIAVGEAAVCGLTADGAAECFGDRHVSDVDLFPGPYQDIATSGPNACGVRGDGQIDCWGRDFGGAADTETCAVGETQLVRDGTSLDLETSTGWGTDTSSADANKFILTRSFDVSTDPEGSIVGEPSPLSFLVMVGQQPDVVTTAGLFESFPEGEAVPVDSAILVKQARHTGTAEFICAAEGSGSNFTRNDNELMFDFSNVVTVNGCEGTSVEGSFTREGGTIDGVAWAPGEGGFFGSGNQFSAYFDDGSELRGFYNDYSFAILVTSPTSPFGSAAFCVDSVVELDSFSYEFSGLTRIDACSAPGTGSSTLRGCVR